MRKIIHVDMDAFYASVEQRDNPELSGLPVIVGGRPDSRGVVATCSYEARRFGVHSAMSCARAYRLCPQAIFLPPRFDTYHQISQQIRSIFYQHTDLVEPLSLDEAYLDVTENKRGIESATWVAREIRKEIQRETRLTASAGVSYNKFIAKLASDVDKPNGLTVVTPDQALDFIAKLPIRRFHGVGKVTEEKMRALGVETGADLRQINLEVLTQSFGKAGHYFYGIARGSDPRAVVPDRVRKSIGKETTLADDLADLSQMMTIIGDLTQRIVAILESQHIGGSTLTLKVKYSDFQSVTRSISRDRLFETSVDILSCAEELLAKTEAGERAVRLLGLTVSHLSGDRPVIVPLQLELPLTWRELE